MATEAVTGTQVVGKRELVAAVWPGLHVEEGNLSQTVALVGPGGVGKTTAAVSVGRDCLGLLDGAVHSVDIGALGPGAIWVIQVHFWVGDLKGAESITDRLMDLTKNHPLTPLRELGLALTGEWLIRKGDPASGLPLVGRYLDLIQAANRFSPMASIAYIEGLTAVGEFTEGKQAAERVLEYSERQNNLIYRPGKLAGRGFDRRLRPNCVAVTGDLAAEVQRLDQRLQANGGPPARPR